MELPDRKNKIFKMKISLNETNCTLDPEEDFIDIKDVVTESINNESQLKKKKD